MPIVEIAGHRIGDERPPFIIAEAGVNHNGDPELAIGLVDAAADAGADAVKFQTFHADALASRDAPQAAYQRERAAAESQLEMLRSLELSLDALRAAQHEAEQRGIVWFSTPFDLASLESLIDLGVPAIKIGSGDLTNLPLLRAASGRGLPILLSTGMATMAEVMSAVRDVRAHGDPPLVLFQTVSAYPADPADANLAAMDSLRRAFDVPVGFSDHTTGLAIPIAATALGAAAIEKHLTLDRGLPGPDHAASLDPAQFREMVAGIRDAYAAVGDGIKAPRPSEEDSRRVSRRSLAVVRDLACGHQLEVADLTALRPATGIPPTSIDEVVGRRTLRALTAGSLLTGSDLEPPLDLPD
jgi:N,N'-diacetyllegionaminate synthase